MIWWIETDQNVFVDYHLYKSMFYFFELQMAGVILLTAMLAGGISLWLKRRKLEKESAEKESLQQDVSKEIWFLSKNLQ
mgnify:CR=1 FL=1